MSVVVMGMDYPEHCIECKFRYNGIHDFCIVEERDFDDEDCDAMERNDWHPDWCPLRPLPEKHGRLIDGDELADGCDDPHWCRWLSEIEDMPTIVEAEGE